MQACLILKTSKSQLTCHTLVTLLCLCSPICMSNHEYKFTIPTNGIALKASTWSLFWIDSFTKLSSQRSEKQVQAFCAGAKGRLDVCQNGTYRIERWYDTGTNTTFTWAKLYKLRINIVLHVFTYDFAVFTRLCTPVLYMFSHVATCLYSTCPACNLYKLYIPYLVPLYLFMLLCVVSVLIPATPAGIRPWALHTPGEAAVSSSGADLGSWFW